MNHILLTENWKAEAFDNIVQLYDSVGWAYEKGEFFDVEIGDYHD